MTELSSEEENEDVLEKEIDDVLEDNFNLETDTTDTNVSFSVNPFYPTLIYANLMKTPNFIY